MKTTKILFWTATSIIFLFEGVMPALYSQTEMAREGIRSLGYPDYFGDTLVICKILGALVLIIPKLPARLKEWAYAGFTFSLLFATISHLVVDGMGAESFFPLIILAILGVSYVCFHKLRAASRREVSTAGAAL